MTRPARPLPRAPLLAAFVLLVWPGAAVAGLHAVSTQSLRVDEDRLAITELIEMAPDRPAAEPLDAARRRLVLPPEAAGTARAAIRFPDGRMEERMVTQGVLELPPEVPPEGLAVALEFSVAATGERAACERRYPFDLMRVQAGLAGRSPGLRLSLGGAPVPAKRSAGLWIASASIDEPIPAGRAVRLEVSGLPTYSPPPYAWLAVALCAALLLAGAVAAWRGRAK